MSRSVRSRDVWSIPKDWKRAQRRSKKAKDKQALRRGREPERDPRSDHYNYW